MSAPTWPPAHRNAWAADPGAAIGCGTGFAFGLAPVGMAYGTGAVTGWQNA